MLEAGTRHTRIRVYQVIIAALLGLTGALAWIAWTSQPERPDVITLTHTACQFLEPETKDHGFTRRERKDCVRINARTGGKRLAEAGPMRLEPGRYTIRIRNRDVPAELGFWLRTDGFNVKNPFHHMYQLSVATKGIGQGESESLTMKLKQGVYRFEGPINPTPTYRIEVGDTG